jgi:hypothetical protein
MRTSAKTLRHYARVSGSPGTRVRILGLFRSLWPLGLVMIALGYLIRAAVPQPALSLTATGLLFLALAVAVAGAANFSRDRLQKYIKGARGEESVARALALLPAQWHVFHGIACRSEIREGGGADLDHVAIGPNAIFVIETKNWSGSITAENNTLLCDGTAPDRDPVEQVKTAAAALRRQLQGEEPLPVVPVLCFSGGSIRNGITGLAGVIICTEDQLCAILQRHQDTHLPGEVRDAVIRLLAAATDP